MGAEIALESHRRYVEASVKTAGSLKDIALSPKVQALSRLSLPEIEAVTDRVAQLVPAGNVPGVILNGLLNLSERRPPLKLIRRDVDLLFKGVEQVLDKVVYSAFFAGPAAIIWGYQNLLKLAGKRPEDAFPAGVWQFYVDYALREDTARHANETSGFDDTLLRHEIHLRPVDRLTAWVMAAIHCLHQYDELLANEWRERVYLALLGEATRVHDDAERYARLPRDWARQRPFGRGSDADAVETYPAYRRARFDRFVAEAMRDLDGDLRDEWMRQVRVAEQEELPAYQQQMSILAYLDPGPYSETHVPIPLEHVHVCLIHRGQYYLIPACIPGTGQPADVAIVRAQVAAMLARPAKGPAPAFSTLARARRPSLARLRSQLHTDARQELDRLRLAPILINGDVRPGHLPLALVRRGERGMGDHALTVFDTGQGFVFDQSHIFFDGAWGAALAEIMTNEALSWAAYLHALPPARPAEKRPCAISFFLTASEQALVKRAPRVVLEANAETEAVNLEPILALRKFFKQRSDLLRLTVNDLLVLYRAIHAVTYQLSPDLLAELQAVTGSEEARQAAQAVRSAIERSREINPAILIPVDASQRCPRDRLYPMTFEVPLNDLDLLDLHQQVLVALDAYRNARKDRSTLYGEFDRLQRTYLSTLAGFGAVLSRAKEIALSGESASVGAIKLLAHMPAPLQRMLDQIPSRIDVLNDVVKGREVFSNVGAVVPSSTLKRFITAKDDNEQKTLAWGVITNAKGIMRITLRDFRPHVRMLQECGRMDLAVRIAQDYLDTYASGLNRFIQDLLRITRASRETRMDRPESVDA
jgi:hypothetical protein